MRTFFPRACPRTAALWTRIQAAPFEVTVGVLATGLGFANLFSGRTDLSAFAYLWYTVLLLGGVGVLVGYLRRLLTVESIGICLLLGGYAFSAMRRVARARDQAELNAALVAFGAIAIGLIIRLIVVRKAFRTREVAAKKRRG